MLTSTPENYLVWINFPTGLFVPPRPIYCVVNFRTGYIPHGNTVPRTVWIVFPTHSKTMFCHQITRFLWHWRLWENMNICNWLLFTFWINFRREGNNSVLWCCHIQHILYWQKIFSEYKLMMQLENSLIPQNRFWAHKDSNSHLNWRIRAILVNWVHYTTRLILAFLPSLLGHPMTTLLPLKRPCLATQELFSCRPRHINDE